MLFIFLKFLPQTHPMFQALMSMAYFEVSTYIKYLSKLLLIGILIIIFHMVINGRLTKRKTVIIVFNTYQNYLFLIHSVFHLNSNIKYFGPI